MNVRLVHDLAWLTATEVVMALDLEDEERVALFPKVHVIIEAGIKLFEDRRRREQSRLARPEEPLTEPPEGPRS